MAFDKYVLGILPILHKHCGDCGCASFVPKCLLFQHFRIILVPFVCPVPVLKCVTVSTETVQQAGGCDQEKAQPSIGTPEYLLRGSLLMTAGHIQPFSVPASRDGVRVKPWWDLSAKVLYTSGVLRSERAISWVQEQSKVSCDEFLISQGSLPFLGSLFGENLTKNQ